MKIGEIMNELLATIVLMCSPQSNKQVKHTCVIWLKRCVYEQQITSKLTDEQALEYCVENDLPQELWPK